MFSNIIMFVAGIVMWANRRRIWAFIEDHSDSEISDSEISDIRKVCPRCDGTKKRFIGNTKIECKECDKDGKISIICNANCLQDATRIRRGFFKKLHYCLQHAAVYDKMFFTPKIMKYRWYVLLLIIMASIMITPWALLFTCLIVFGTIPLAFEDIKYGINVFRID